LTFIRACSARQPSREVPWAARFALNSTPDPFAPFRCHARSTDRPEALRLDIAQLLAKPFVFLLNFAPGSSPLTPQKLHLLPEPFLARMAHPWGLLAADGCVGHPHLRERGPFCLYHFERRTCPRTTCHSSDRPK